MEWWRIPDAQTIGEIPEISDLTHDSRLIQPGWGFAALPGRVTDGHAYLDRAIESGATACVVWLAR